MSKIDRDKILKKVRALFKVTQKGSGAFEGEIQNASRLMQKLMDQYNVSIAEAMADEQDLEEQEKFVSVSSDLALGRRKAWHWYLARAVGRVTNTKHYSHGAYRQTVRDPKGHKKVSSRMTFYGTKEAAAMAQEIFDFWYLEIDRMARIATSEYVKEATADPDVQMMLQMCGVKQFRHLPHLGANHPNIWRDSWCYGVTNGIHKAITEEQEERSKETSTALMVLNTRLAKAYKEFSSDFKTTSAAGNRSLNADAWEAGLGIGRNLNLKTAVAKKIKEER